MRRVCRHRRDHVRPARFQPATCQAPVALHAQLGTTATQAGLRPHRAFAVKGIFLQEVKQHARSALWVRFAMRRDCVCQVATALRALSLLRAPLRVRLALRGCISRRRARGCACSVLPVVFVLLLVYFIPQGYAILAGILLEVQLVVGLVL